MKNECGINRFYTSLQHMHKLYDKRARKEGLRACNAEEFWGWRQKSKTKLHVLLGLDKMAPADIKPIVEERKLVEPGIIREKVIIQTEPDVWMPFFILIPEACVGNSNAKIFIAPCGHLGGGKFSVAGYRINKPVSDAIDFYNYDYGMQLAKKGFVVLCPDARGFGERRDLNIQSDENFLDSSCNQLAHMAEPLGMTVAGMFTWDLMRLVDYIEERNEWNANDIACIGFSGGGMQALWFAALDDRIKKVIISGYMYGYKDSLLELNNNCSCNYVPHLWESFDMGDIGALMAPAKVVIQSCKEDKLNGARGIVNTVEQVNIMRDAYELIGLSDNVMHDICEGTHKWHSENLDKYLRFLYDISE